MNQSNKNSNQKLRLEIRRIVSEYNVDVEEMPTIAPSVAPSENDEEELSAPTPGRRRGLDPNKMPNPTEVPKNEKEILNKIVSRYKSLK